MSEDRAKLLPFYLVIDVSWSMDEARLRIDPVEAAPAPATAAPPGSTPR